MADLILQRRSLAFTEDFRNRWQLRQEYRGVLCWEILFDHAANYVLTPCEQDDLMRVVEKRSRYAV